MRWKKQSNVFKASCRTVGCSPDPSDDEGRASSWGDFFSLPPDWFPVCSLRRVVVHSAPVCEPLDDLLPCYHFLIAKGGAVARGVFSLADNASPQRGQGYARHTHAFNIGSAGVLLVGKSPNERQWNSLVSLCRLLCSRYQLDVRDVQTHGELEPDTDDLVGWGDRLRQAIGSAPLPECEEPPAYVNVFVGDTKLLARQDGGDLWVPRTHLTRQLGCLPELPMETHIIYGTALVCVPLRQVLSSLHRHVVWDTRLRALKLEPLEE
ncbi:MAG: hypothetical protein KatS3mg022_3423 [Armatimonadota bacterium]|nr:MAG: hypothetical protein KatS3mg022_1439 [Armatimonadota bacterium]GIV16012.1 MAG: hypothetical protein KatS3mg022_1447 [Armatimonadota bacterium]GIV17988.1 MAG: hypothetical protein KatS3mg022_3423 [Armatimonadota bacterium]